jgi:hypothetical protein
MKNKKWILGLGLLWIAAYGFAGTHSASTTCTVDTTKDEIAYEFWEFTDTSGAQKSDFQVGETVRIKVRAYQAD